MSAIAGIAGLAGFVWLTVFQLLLALGLPIGAMAWRGRHRVLPPSLRAASAASAVLAVLGAVTVAQASGLGPVVLPEVLIRPLLGAFAALFALSLVGNAASQSAIERWHGVPLTVILSLSCAVLLFS